MGKNPPLYIAYLVAAVAVTLVAFREHQYFGVAALLLSILGFVHLYQPDLPPPERPLTALDCKIVLPDEEMTVRLVYKRKPGDTRSDSEVSTFFDTIARARATARVLDIKELILYELRQSDIFLDVEIWVEIVHHRRTGPPPSLSDEEVEAELDKFIDSELKRAEKAVLRSIPVAKKFDDLSVILHKIYPTWEKNAGFKNRFQEKRRLLELQALNLSKSPKDLH